MVYPTGGFGVWVIFEFHSFSAAESPHKLFLIEDFHFGVKQWVAPCSIQTKYGILRAFGIGRNHRQERALLMKKGDMEEQILRASKEIVVKFIEVGRLSPTNFAETFKSVYRAVEETVKPDPEEADAPEKP
jgi:hypothetical protein